MRAPEDWIRLMTEHGFRPTGNLGAPVVEFEKRYYDPETDIHYTARAELTRGRGAATALTGFVVTALAAIPATLEAADQAPTCMREDLRGLVLTTTGTPDPVVPVHMTICLVCEQPTSSYIIVATIGGPRTSAAVCTGCYQGTAPGASP